LDEVICSRFVGIAEVLKCVGWQSQGAENPHRVEQVTKSKKVKWNGFKVTLERSELKSAR
jgi:hypothetical protein